MDPISVLRTMWQFKWVTLSVVALTAFASIYTSVFAEHTYRATMTFALITPKIPTLAEVTEKPELAKLNSDNPYLRSPDNTLLSQVLITKMRTEQTIDQLRADGLSTDYSLSQPARDPSQASFGPGMLLQLTASGTTPQIATRTAADVGDRIMVTLREMQKINGADDQYLATVLSVGGPPQAQEDRSSDLRSLIAFALGGGVLLFGALSVARKVQLARDRQLARQASQFKKDWAENHAEPPKTLWAVKADR